MGAESVVLVVEGPSLFLAVPAMGTFAGLDSLVDLADDDDGGGVEEVPFVRGLEVGGAGGTPCWLGESFRDGEVGGSGDFAGGVSTVGSFPDAVWGRGLDG